MKISSKTKYALMAVMALAMNGPERTFRTAEIVKKYGLSRKFLEQVLIILRNGGVLTSIRGRQGGYSLARPADQLTLWSIVSLTENSLMTRARQKTGTEIGARGLSARSASAQASGTALDEVWFEVENRLMAELKKITVRNICERARRLNEGNVLAYVI